MHEELEIFLPTIQNTTNTRILGNKNAEKMMTGKAEHTGQVPPEMIRSKDKASGMPIDAETLVLLELMERSTDCVFSERTSDNRAESTWEGRRYSKE